MRPWHRRCVEVVLLVTIAVLILIETRMLWFFSDDWAFILGRRDLRLSGRTADFLWYPHNEHLMGGLSSIYVVVIALFGISSQFPFMVLLMLGHVAVLWMVATLIRRAGLRWEWGLVAMVWLGFFGGGNENLIWPVQIGYVWSLALSLGAALIATRSFDEGDGGLSGLRRRLLPDAVASLLNVLALFIGPTAIVVMIGSGAVLAVERPIRRSWMRAVRVLALPTSLYLWWYLTYGRRFSPPWGHPARRMPAYLVRGVTNALDHTVAIRGGGLVLFLVSAALCVRVIRNDSARRVLVLCTACLIAFHVSNTYARAGLGTVQSTSPRYVGVTAVFAVPIFVIGSSEFIRRVRGTRFAAAPRLAVVATAVVGLLGINAVWRNAHDLHVARRAREAVLYEIRPTIEIAALHATSPVIELGEQPEPKYDPDITMGRLAEAVTSGMLKPRSNWSIEQLLAGSLQFGVVVRRDGPTAASSNRGLVMESAEGASGMETGCIDLIVSPEHPASVTFAPGQPGGFVRISALPSTGTVELSVTLVAGEVSTAARLLGPVTPAPLWLGVDPFTGTTTVRFESGSDPGSESAGEQRVAVCGVSPES